MRIEATGIAAGFGRIAVLRGVDVAVHPGEMVGLVGPNGSGKTTLLRVLASLMPAQAGTVRYDGRSARELRHRDLARRIAYLAQGGTVHWDLRVEALVALGRLPHRHPFQGPSTADREAVERALEAADIVALRERTLAEVSGGERRRVLLARALAVEADTLLADEPTAALDPLHQLQVMGLLRQAAGRGRAVVVVLHDLTLAARFCDRLVLLAGGGVLAQGRPDDVLSDRNIAAAYAVEAIRGEHAGMPYLVPWAPSTAPRQQE
jgi:iron complex transport system ATP-binding protein